MVTLDEMASVGLSLVVVLAVLGMLVIIVVKVYQLFPRIPGKKRQEEEKKEEEDKEEALRLYLAPEAEEAMMPSLRNHIAVPLRDHNILPAYVNHHYCEIFVDCGTSSALMKYHRAEHLGLLSQATRSKVIQVRMWARKTMARMLVVEAVMVELAGGVSFPCTFLVAPKHGPMNYLMNDIFLDNATLRRTRAIQCFSPSSTRIFFPSPIPEWRPRTSPDSQFLLDGVRLGKCVKAESLNVHLDTGARFFYSSKKYHRPERPVEVVVAGNSVLRWEELKAAPTSTFDFVLGTSPLTKYRCTLDFAKNHLYICINDRVYRARLRRTSTL